jgi:hypothetical protein
MAAMATEQVIIPERIPMGGPERPRLIFSTELGDEALLALLRTPGVLTTLAAHRDGVALLLPTFDDARVQVTRLLNAHGVPAIAWLCLPPAEGQAFNLRNYPRALARYQDFHAWARQHHLRFEAVGLSMEPPLEDVDPAGQREPRALLRRLWLARDNVLYPSAHTAYGELIVAIHHDGYDVHTYQMPVIADDRRAGSTLIQRVLDIVDMPSDLDVLMCSSSVPIDLFGNDLGGALIASYAGSADAIGIGSIGDDDPEADEPTPLPWPAFQRDLLLAAQHTDTIYVYSLDDCVERGLLPRIAALDWERPVHPAHGRRALIGVLRSLLFAILVAGRFGRVGLAWGGWALAIALWWRGRRGRRDRAGPHDH